MHEANLTNATQQGMFETIKIKLGILIDGLKGTRDRQSDSLDRIMGKEEKGPSPDCEKPEKPETYLAHMNRLLENLGDLVGDFKSQADRLEKLV